MDGCEVLGLCRQVAASVARDSINAQLVGFSEQKNSIEHWCHSQGESPQPFTLSEVERGSWQKGQIWVQSRAQRS